MELTDEWWSNRYQANDLPWDAGAVTSPLKNYIDQLADKSITILIPGCGNGYEAEYLLQQGFTNITLTDISTTLCAKLEAKFAAHRSKEINIICGDFFALQGSYDLVIEQTFFCALNPNLRTVYAEKIYSLLKPGGRLVGVLFNCTFENNPPFGGSENEYRQLFQQKFTIAVLDACYNSIAPRSGKELFVKLVKDNLVAKG